MTMKTVFIVLLILLVSSPIFAAPKIKTPILLGRAVIAADSYVEGPTSGQFISGGDLTTATAIYKYILPFENKQPIQGFSAIAEGPIPGTFYVMQDNGFGGKAASPDALLHIYAVKPDWKAGTIKPVDFITGKEADSFTLNTFIRLRDPSRMLGYPLVADGVHYPIKSTTPTGRVVSVDPLIKQKRFVTGYDLDIESFAIDNDGNFWLGDEFGPFLIKTDKTGKVLEKEIPVPNNGVFSPGTNLLIQTPNNPYLVKGNENLPGSGGLEGMTINKSKTQIYTLFERELNGETDAQRRIFRVFDIKSKKYLDKSYAYRVESGTYKNARHEKIKEIFSVNDMVAINDNEIIIIEKDRGAGDVRTGNFKKEGVDRVAARVKKVYKVDLRKIDKDGYLEKNEIVDLMKIADPNKIGGADTINGVFTFPMECIEAVLVVDATTLMFINDNNYPGGASSRRPNRVDDTEFILVRLPQPLNVGN